MDRKLRKKVWEAIQTRYHNVEKMRVRNGLIHAYGQMPNTNQTDWFFVTCVWDVEVKGAHCIL